MMYPSVSIIIPTFNSERVLSQCLRGASKQTYPKDAFEAMIVDNGSTDDTRRVARSFSVRILTHQGPAPQVCAQRNLGIRQARYDWVLILDHDMQMREDVLLNFSRRHEREKHVDAWYIPEIVYAGSAFLTRMRTLENRFYDGTVMNAARLIRKTTIQKTDGYDVGLSSGPADWDMDMQLRINGAKFGILDAYVFHHEEHLSAWQFILKKGNYAHGCDRYRTKWKRNHPQLYREVVRKQFSVAYRCLIVFVERGKWRRAVKQMPMVLCIIITKVLMAMVLFIKRI